MSETEGQEEPTMEEILASIRKIISEDDVEEGEAIDVTEKADEPEPELEVDIELEDEDQILELTDEIEEEIEEEVIEEPEPEIELEPEPEDDPEPEPKDEPEAEKESELAIDDVDPASDEDVLASNEASNFSMDQFGVLSNLLTTGYQGAGNTLEDLVREMLKPMLREWLDRNLPPIVERMVAKEIARLARTKRP